MSLFFLLFVTNVFRHIVTARCKNAQHSFNAEFHKKGDEDWEYSYCSLLETESFGTATTIDISNN